MQDTAPTSKSSEKVQVGVSLPTELVKELDKIAEEQDRPRASVIRKLLAEVIRNKRAHAA
jgi:metal-responsive CopG/Arc/MetJ family transcriptional regulator